MTPFFFTVTLFVGLFFMLFVGDGIQSVTDFLGAELALLLGIIFLLKEKRVVFPPRRLRLWWGAFVLVAAGSTMLSASIGYSIFWWARLASAYVVFILFYSISSPKALRMFVVGLVVFVAAATVAAGAAWAFPAASSWLPTMNLLVLTRGHNHLVDLLVLVFPSVLIFSSGKKFGWVAVSLLVVAVLATFARGAWLVLAAFCLYCLLKNRPMKIAWLVLTAFFVGIFAASTLSASRPGLFVPRLGYWEQAVRAIQEQPLLGRGPKSFSLSSKKYQGAPGEFSWFAHSLPLQTGAELGLVGLFIFVLFLFMHLRHAIPPPENRTATGLFFGLTLALVYSIFEFNMDYFVVFLVWWAGLGVLAGLRPPQERGGHIDVSSRVALIFLATFCVAWSFLLPFQLPEKLARTFYKEDPDVLVSLAQKKLEATDLPAARALYVQSIAANPFDQASYFALADILHEENSLQEEVDTYKKILSLPLDAATRVRVSERLKSLWSEARKTDEFSLQFALAGLLIALEPFSAEVFEEKFRVIEAAETLDPQEGRRLLLEFVAIWPETNIHAFASQSAYVSRAWIAIGDWKQAVAYDAKNPDLYDHAAFSLIDRGFLEEARELRKRCGAELNDFSWCLHLFSDDTLSRRWRADAQEKKSIPSLELSIFADPWRGDSYVLLSRWLEEEGRSQDRQKLYRECDQIFDEPWCATLISTSSAF